MIAARDDIKPAFENRNIPVVMVADGNYLPFLEVTVRSIVASTPNSNIDLLVLHANIPQDRCDAATKDLSGHKNLSIRFVDVSAAVNGSGLSEFGQNSYVTVSTCFKLLAPVILCNFEKAILLDIDIAVNHDLTELFETDLRGNIFAGVPDGAEFSKMPQFVAWAKQNGFEELDRYINAGVLVVNFDAYRKEQLITTLVPVTIAASKVKWYNEQDAINFCCKDKIRILDLRWNVQVGNHCIKSQLEATGGEAYITHFVTSRKPWRKPEHMMAHLWWLHAGINGIKLWRAAFGLSCEETESGDGMAVSVIVPVYNAEAYLSMMLISLLAQTLRNIEIICVDDGSTDKSAAILNEFSSNDPRVRVITQKNSGGAIARNRGIDEARGRWLFFADADDFCRPDMLADMVSCGEAQNADVVVAGRIHINCRNFNQCQEMGIPDSYFQVEGPISANKQGINVFAGLGFAPWNKLYRSSFIQQCGIRFHQIPPTDDVFFVLMTLVDAERIALLGKSYYYYRAFLPNSQMGNSDKHPTNFLKAFLEIRDAIAGRELELRKQFFKAAIRSCFDNLFRRATDKTIERTFSILQTNGLRALEFPDIPPSTVNMGMYDDAYRLALSGASLLTTLFTHFSRRNEELSFEAARETQIRTGMSMKIDELRAANEEKKLRIAEADKTKKTLSAKVEELRAANEEKKLKIAEADKIKKTLSAKVDELRAANEEKKLRIAEADKTKKTLSAKVDELRAANEEKKLRIAVAKKERERLQKILESVQAACV